MDSSSGLGLGVERSLTNCPARPKIHFASYLWASETLKHVDCVWHKRARFLTSSRLDQSFVHKLITQSVSRPPSRGIPYGSPGKAEESLRDQRGSRPGWHG